MKLYAFQPRSYGELSFFVMAESEVEARAAVDNYGTEPHEKEGWGTNYYELTVADAGQVLVNSND